LAALSWRMVDPKGSYAALYDASHYMTEMVAGYDVLARFISIVLVDQFNGLMLGIALTALLYMALGSLKQVMRLPFRLGRKREFPLSRYAVPKRFVRTAWFRQRTA